MIRAALARGLRAIADRLDPHILTEEQAEDLRALAEARRMVQTLETQAEIIRLRGGTAALH